MNSVWLFLLVFTAIASGWLLGRYASGRPALPGAFAGSRQYYQGLNYLLNEQPDDTIDAFIQSLEVTPDTLETHLAVGNLMRRKGEVERAIRIHQNLLARPSLPPQQLHQAHLELARDYIRAGLLDRAERLLQDLVQQSAERRDVSLRHLVEIYQAEQDWQKAIDTAERLMPKRSLLFNTGEEDPQLAGAIAHFHCELAQQAMENNDLPATRDQLKQALARDRLSVRASLLQGTLEYRSGNFQDAARSLRRVRHQNPAMLPEVLDTLQACYDAMGERHALRDYLQQCLQQYPSTRVTLALCEEIRHNQDAVAAADFLAERLRQRPTLRGLLALTTMHRDQSEGRARDNLDGLQSLLQSLLASKPTYQCLHCGFAGRQLHWLCPRCKQWNSVQPIRGVEGD